MVVGSVSLCRIGILQDHNAQSEGSQFDTVSRSRPQQTISGVYDRLQSASFIRSLSPITSKTLALNFRWFRGYQTLCQSHETTAVPHLPKCRCRD